MKFVDNLYDYLIEDPHGSLTLYTRNEENGCLHCYVYKNGMEHYGIYVSQAGHFRIIGHERNTPYDRKGFIQDNEHPVTLEEMNRLMTLEDIE